MSNLSGWLLVAALVAVPIYWALNTRSARTEFSYRTLRVFVGLISVSIASVAIYTSGDGELTSISASYHTHGQDLFVGSLLIVSAFLFAYQGDPKERLFGHTPALRARGWLEFTAAKVGAIGIATVALFPTSDCPNNVCSVLPHYLGLVDVEESQVFHKRGAMTFFVCLVAFLVIYVLRVKAKLGGRPDSRFWLTPAIRIGFYAAGLAAIGAAGIIMAFDLLAPRSVFWAEWLALMGFGVAWFVAGVQSDNERGYELIKVSDEYALLTTQSHSLFGAGSADKTWLVVSGDDLDTTAFSAASLSEAKQKADKQA